MTTLTQGHNFDLGFLTQGQIWFLTWGRFFIYFFEFGWWFKVKSWFSTQGWILILLMMTHGQDSFIFGFQWMTLGQEFHLFFFFYNLRLKFNCWLVTQGQGLILMERWFAHPWGLNDWFWRFFLMCLWRFVHEEVFPWIFFIEVIYGDFHCEEFFFYSWRFFNVFFLTFFLWDCSIVKICSMLILRLKNCFSLLVLRLKSLCWLFDSRSLA